MISNFYHKVKKKSQSILFPQRWTRTLAIMLQFPIALPSWANCLLTLDWRISFLIFRFRLHQNGNHSTFVVCHPQRSISKSFVSQKQFSLHPATRCIRNIVMFESYLLFLLFCKSNFLYIRQRDISGILSCLKVIWNIIMFESYFLFFVFMWAYAQ